MILLPIKIDPGAVVPVAAYGQFVYFESATGPGDTSITVKAQGGSGVDYVLKVGQGFRTDEAFSQLIISNNKGEGTITGVVVVADENFFDNRVVGTVSIAGTVGVIGKVTTIDAGRDRALANQSFIGSVMVNTSNTYNMGQLWNPAGSGKNIVLRNIQAQAGGATSAWIYAANAQIANPAAQPNAAAKLVGGANSTATIRQENAAAVPAGSVLMSNLTLPQYSLTQIPLIDPIVIRPGYGVTIAVQNAAIYLISVFDFYEE